MSGLFDTFTIAKRGLSVQQSNINTSSHNIANASTEGYSRQRSVAHTTRPFGGMSRFDGCAVGQIGTGAEIAKIMRIRDSFLDYQVRTENTNYGTAQIKNEYLTQVEDILNENSDTGIQTYLSKFYNAFQDLSTTAGASKDTNRTSAFKASEQLADLINSKYLQLENKKSDAQKELNNETSEINGILDQINDLSKQISSIVAVGMTPNDLMDSRDSLIDQLSTKFGIKIDKEARETMNLSVTEDPSAGNLVNSEPTDKNYTRFSYVTSAEYATVTVGGVTTTDYTHLNVTYYVLGNKDLQKTITVTGTAAENAKLKNDLLEDRMLIADKDGNVVSSNTTTAPAAATDAEGPVSYTINSNGIGTIVDNKMINGVLTTVTTTKTAITTAAALDKQIFNNITKGEIAGIQQVEDNMQDYMDRLDKFAASLAYTVNAIQTGDRGITGDPGIIDKSGNKITTECLFVVKNPDGTSSHTDTGITAKNITFNDAFTDDPSLLNCGKYSVDDNSGEGAGDRAHAIADLAKLKINIGNLSIADGDISSRTKFFDPVTGTDLDFDSAGVNLVTDHEGTTLGEYYGTVLGDIYSNNNKANDEITSSTKLLESLNNERQSVSGVSLDEEMTDLIQFQHAYQANAKMINTIDQLLDVVINGLKA